MLRYPTYVGQTIQAGQKDGLNVLGLILFLITFVVLALARALLLQLERKAGA